MRYLSFFNWGITLTLTALHIIFIHPSDDFCLHLIERQPLTIAMAITSIQSGVDIVYIVMILLIMSLLIYFSQQSRIDSGRPVSKYDYELYFRSALHMTNSTIAWLTQVIYVLIIILESYISLTVMEIISLFIIPVSTIIDPLVYSLSTKQFWPAVCHTN